MRAFAAAMCRLSAAIMAGVLALGCSSERTRTHRDVDARGDGGSTHTEAEGTAGLASEDPEQSPQESCAPDATGSVRFSAPSGTFEGTLAVELSATAAGAEIRYTTNRMAPTVESPLYSGEPLSLSVTTEVRAQAFADGSPLGEPTTRLYVARAFDQVHDLPLVVLDAFGHGALSRQDRTYVDVGLAVFGLEGGTTALSRSPQVATHAGFHVRGQSSASFPKTPFRIELRNSANEDQDCPLVGMPADSDWALVGPYPDKALIRNAFVYSLGPDMGLVAPRFAMVELYLNVAPRPLDSSDYMGVYSLVETIKNQKDRLDLKQLEMTDTALPVLTGGYIFKFEWRAAEAPLVACTGSTSTCWSDLELVDPNPPAPEQLDYITRYLASFNDGMHTDELADPELGYPAYLDTASFVNHVIINELTRSMDAYVRSQYFYKDRDAKIAAGPLWDFDLILNVGGYFDNLAIDGWQYQENAGRETSDWFQLLLADPSFYAQLVARWQELRQGVLSDSELSARIDKLATSLATAPERNFERWDNLTDARVGPFTTPTADTWRGQVGVMQDWLLRRTAWLDTQWQ